MKKFITLSLLLMTVTTTFTINEAQARKLKRLKKTLSCSVDYDKKALRALALKEWKAHCDAGLILLPELPQLVEAARRIRMEEIQKASMQTIKNMLANQKK